MSIVSRDLTKLANREDTGPGIKVWRAEGVDAKGRRWVHGPFSGTQAEADVIRDAAWPTTQLQRSDFSELIKWVEEKNTVASFDFTDRDITEAEGEDHVTAEFASRLGDEAIQLAWWIEGLSTPTWNAIVARVGWDGTTATTVQDRAIALDAAEASYNQVIV